MPRHDLTVHDIPLTDLRNLQPNAHTADLEALEESILVNGFTTPILVQRSTGTICAGNHRYYVAMKLGWPTIPGIYLDIDDEAAYRLALADNRVAALGHDDEADILLILQGLAESDQGLMGTGYLQKDIDFLQKLLDEPLDFDDSAHVETLVDTSPKRGPWELLPVRDSDGTCTELTLTRADFGPLGLADYQEARRMVGLAPISRQELKDFDIEGW